MFFVNFKEKPLTLKPEKPKVSCPLCFKRVLPHNLKIHKKSSLCKKNMTVYHKNLQLKNAGLNFTL